MSNPWDEAAEAAEQEVAATAREVWNSPEFESGREFIVEKLKRGAMLAWQYQTEKDEARRVLIVIDLGDVQQSVRNEMARMAVMAGAETQRGLWDAALVALGIIARMFPALVQRQGT